jgi:hypothetical protein
VPQPFAYHYARASAILVDRFAGGVAAPTEVVDQILSRANGVPLFLQELTKTVLESVFLSSLICLEKIGIKMRGLLVGVFVALMQAVAIHAESESELVLQFRSPAFEDLWVDPESRGFTRAWKSEDHWQLSTFDAVCQTIDCVNSQISE